MRPVKIRGGEGHSGKSDDFLYAAQEGVFGLVEANVGLPQLGYPRRGEGRSGKSDDFFYAAWESAFDLVEAIVSLPLL